ncbi:YeiH family protein [Sphingobium sp. Cam5-1]|uniref:YeiH family protein n=1 Tax=Sphingobium sp. Cam5-1 TaxID=2789327 RepID=UPI0018AD1F8B|nr:putative sulfate exporter family transporter [Sphingobium sp. Cam5-1]QPI72254.1 putative sulfate exporter family transporter [Sphingobium sp. Cam5-1]
MSSIVAPDRYGDVPATIGFGWRDHVPGLLIVALGTLAAGFLSDHYGAPLTLMALLLGLSLNFLSADPRLHPGLGFASHSLLRWGIVLIGARLTVGQVAGLGPIALASVLGVLVATMGVGILVARKLGCGVAFGTLAGGAVAICGASAAMALAATLGKKRVSEAQLTLVLVGISAMSAAAMILYPVAAHMLSLSNSQAGFMLGASIHDVAQALGAGYAYSEPAGQIAAIVKLTRVAFLAPVLAVIALFLKDGKSRAKGLGLPWFVIGFFALAGINSLGVIPEMAGVAANKAATALLAAAVVATAVRSPLPLLIQTGRRPLIVIFCSTFTAFVLALSVALYVVG